MKALVWFISLVIFAVVQNILNSSGIVLGAIPATSLFCACTSVAGKICRKIGR